MKLFDHMAGRIFVIFLGGFLYAAGMNFFIVSQSLYSGGAVGLAQLLEVFFVRVLGFQGGNTYGVIYILINLPLFIVAYKALGKRFLFETFVGVISISLFTATLPIINTLELDRLTSLLIGGIVTGFGIGLILLAGGCGGGLDIIAVWATQKYRNASVGRISLYFNIILYGIFLFISDAQTVIYSVIYMFIFTIVLDRVHYQNINVRMMIFTKKEGVDDAILEKTGRGVTEWHGTGGYTGEDTRILISCINKYEIQEIESIVHEIDPSAFVIRDEGVAIGGNFEKRL